MLNILEYSSTRARMSVIARGPDGGIHVFTKGADARVGVGAVQLWTGVGQLATLQLVDGTALRTGSSRGPDLPAAERQRAGALRLADSPTLLLSFGYAVCGVNACRECMVHNGTDGCLPAGIIPTVPVHTSTTQLGSECLQVLSMVRGLTAPDLYAATEHNLHEFAVNVRPASPTLF